MLFMYRLLVGCQIQYTCFWSFETTDTCEAICCYWWNITGNMAINRHCSIMYNSRLTSCDFLALVNLSFIPQYNIQQFLMLLLFTFTDLYIIPKIRLEQTVTLVSFLIVQYTSLLYCASLVSSWIVVFQAGVIRENTEYKWFCWNNSWKLRFCFVILLVWQIISLVPRNFAREISKIWNVILLYC